MSKKKWLTQSVSQSVSQQWVSDKVTYWAVRWQLKIRGKWFTWPQIRCWPPWLAARWDRQPSFPQPPSSHPGSPFSRPTLPIAMFLPTSLPNSSYHQPEPKTPKYSFFIHNTPTDNSSHIYSKTTFSYGQISLAVNFVSSLSFAVTGLWSQSHSGLWSSHTSKW